MNISGSYAVPVPQERAYQLLQDPVILAKCMPGTDHLERIGPDEYQMKMKVLIASIGGLFAGKVRLADQKAPESFKLIVEGTGKIGFLKGEGVLTLVPRRMRPRCVTKARSTWEASVSWCRACS